MDKPLSLILEESKNTILEAHTHMESSQSAGTLVREGDISHTF